MASQLFLCSEKVPVFHIASQWDNGFAAKCVVLQILLDTFLIRSFCCTARWLLDSGHARWWTFYLIKFSLETPTAVVQSLIKTI
jgi:hypothetical protein